MHSSLTLKHQIKNYHHLMLINES